MKIAWAAWLIILALMTPGCGAAGNTTETEPLVLETAAATTAVETSAEPPAAETLSPGSVILKDGRGREVPLTLPAQRIVSLAPALTETLFALGAGSRLVGRDSFSDYPAETTNISDVGGGFGDLNLEAILAQSPDLILVSDLTPEEQVQALEKAGLTVYVLDNPADLEGMYTGLQTVGFLTGHSSEAETLIVGLKKRVSAVQAKISGVSERPLVFYEIDGTDPAAIWTPGPGTFIDTMIRMAGGENMGSTLTDDWVQVSLEEIIARDPDLILLGDATWGGVTAEAVAARSGWGTLRAVQTGNVYPFDDNIVSRPGPRLVDGLEALAKLLHPDLF